jgi:Na+/melibiose symporter-like transporter
MCRKEKILLSRFTAFKRFSLTTWRLTLLHAALLDELVTGLLVVGLPLVRTQLGLSYLQVGLLFSIGALVTMLLEPAINLLSDRSPKHYWVLSGAFTLVLAMALASVASTFALLLLAFVLFYLADSVTVGLSQAALVDARPAESTRTMTCWTLMSGVGDLLGPLAVALVVSFRFGWSQLCWLAATCWLAFALVLTPQHFPSTASNESDESNVDDAGSTPSLLAQLRAALRTPDLLRWAVLSFIPSMVDEVFLAFTTLYLHDNLHIHQASIGLIVTLEMLCSLLSLFLIERFLLKRIAPHKLLAWLAVLTLLGMIAFFILHTPWIVILALCIIDIGAVGWYPLATGQAYACLSGRSGTVLAVINLFTPLEAALPGLIGLVAGRFGLITALGVLATAPLWMLIFLLGYKKTNNPVSIS